MKDRMVLLASVLFLLVLVLMRVTGKAVVGEIVERPLDRARIVVFKSERRLEVYSGAVLYRSFRIGLGSHPAGPKSREGDGRTPEGEYYVCLKNSRSNFYLSLGLSYPNERDAERGMQSGLIIKAQYDEIVRAVRSREKPPWDTPLGGEIFIHGRGSRNDWTRGCIALDDEHIRELYAIIPTGTPVTIRP